MESLVNIKHTSVLVVWIRAFDMPCDLSQLRLGSESVIVFLDLSESESGHLVVLECWERLLPSIHKIFHQFKSHLFRKLLVEISDIVCKVFIISFKNVCL